MFYKFINDAFIDAIICLGCKDEGKLFFEKPKNPEHGDLSTNIAMLLARELERPPRDIANSIIRSLEYDPELIEAIDIAGPGFINIKFTNNFYAGELISLYNTGNKIGKSQIGNGQKVNVEYVSVNPTGLLHLGHGRNAVTGDTVANLYENLGFEVTREYYFNNAGNQMNNLAKSIYARYKQFVGDNDYIFPEDGYHGDYIKEIASALFNEKGDSLRGGSADDLSVCRKFGEKWCFDKILHTLSRMNIEQDVFFNEDSLYHDGKIDSLVRELKEKELAYEKEGALWLALNKMGLNDDRVIIKSSGEPTYRLPDIAYHIDKFQRGYDLIVDIFGADHIATIPDVLAALGALGLDTNKVKVLIHQFVTLTENGEQVKMSKRTGKNYTLDDLLDEVGGDVVRFFLLMRGISTHLEFDLSLAREQSEKNPVFYLQYAHARICSVEEHAKSLGLFHPENFSIQTLSASQIAVLLNGRYELELLKALMKYPEVVESAGLKCEPQVLADYLREAASAFHVFYHECRIAGAPPEAFAFRMCLLLITKNIIANGLRILGISAPKKM